MASQQVVRSEVHNYLILGDQLKAQYANIDDETLHDTLEGISDLPQLIQEVVRSSLEDETLIAALRTRIGEMGERLKRFRSRVKKNARSPVGRWAVPALIAFRRRTFPSACAMGRSALRL